jgi:hypothetical protein
MLTGFLTAKTSTLMKSQTGCNITKKKKRYSLISSSPLGAVLPNDLFLFATKILYAFLIIFYAGYMSHPHDPSIHNHPNHQQKSINYEPIRYAIYSSLLSLHLSWIQTFSCLGL